MTAPLTDRYPQARDFTLPGGSTAVLMIHGFTATPAQMRRLGGYLGEQGYTVRGMLLPGHGATVEEMLTRLSHQPCVVEIHRGEAAI